jgi:hypothetical protein
MDGMVLGSVEVPLALSHASRAGERERKKKKRGTEDEPPLLLLLRASRAADAAAAAARAPSPGGEGAADASPWLAGWIEGSSRERRWRRR